LLAGCPGLTRIGVPFGTSRGSYKPGGDLATEGRAVGEWNGPDTG